MNKLMIIGGPTGIGKSDVGVRLAKRYGGLVVGADSMQIYKGLDIGTGKITEGEKCGIEHTMIDIVQPNVDFSVQNYVQEARKVICRAHKEKKLPIVVGGTGLYINALINEQNFADALPNAELRNKYNSVAAEKGSQYLHEVLQKIDPLSAQKISPNDTKRIVRALEIYETTGKPKSSAVKQSKSDYDIAFYVLESERTSLYEKINARVDKMFARGLVKEVFDLSDYWNCRCMEAIGYKEIINAFREGRAPNEAAEEVKRNSRRYAKRQMTFFRWIPFEKKYVSQDFFNNITSTADEWVRR